MLGGLISPMDGIGPAQLRVKELIERIGREEPHEIILATNPNAEGEATALYLSRLLQPLGVVGDAAGLRTADRRRPRLRRRDDARQSARRPPDAVASPPNRNFQLGVTNGITRLIRAPRAAARYARVGCGQRGAVPSAAPLVASRRNFKARSAGRRRAPCPALGRRSRSPSTRCVAAR